MDKLAFQRDWHFYLNNRQKFNFCGCIVPEIPNDLDGVSAMEAFFALDSLGKWLPCREPQLLRDVWICKKSVNFHCKMWAQGYHDAFMGVAELIDSFDDPPYWVELSLKKQIYKASKKLKK